MLTQDECELGRLLSLPFIPSFAFRPVFLEAQYHILVAVKLIFIRMIAVSAFLSVIRAAI